MSHDREKLPSSITIVDDPIANLQLLSTILVKHGYQVRCFSFEQISLVKVEELKDLILLASSDDPERSYAFYQKLRNDPLTRQIPVILIDPSEQTLAQIQAIAVGSADYITKPFHHVEILTRVENQLKILHLQNQLQDCRIQLQQEIFDHDTTKRALKRSQKDFREIEECTNALLNAIPDKIFRHHIDGSFLDIKGKSADLILPREALIESNLRNLPMPEALKADLLERIRTAVETGETQTFEHELAKPDGIFIYESRFVKSGADEAVCIVRDITERQRMEAALQQANLELERLANLDGLTGIANRRRFDEYLNREWLRLAREQFPLSLILCDVDCFKQYNDTYGHLEGDKCLQQVAKVFAAVVKRPADLAARYGGEEFALLLPNTDLSGAIVLAEQARLAIKCLCIRHDTSSVGAYITLSLGVASTIPIVGSQPQVLISAADAALYKAKYEGRDRMCADKTKG
ncbi:diguanylate cyclase domain-containing protein [Pseudanabaena sp. PCC 6802]|uniref:GGDEF domain-containing response regulator n=1 Tax=Pseudanabaena sp. PCC 6802 TaxID=118173 RepID=UPI00034BC3EB|nr:diguanylate cyclase [Pseudanabaena sp. PCC 6802]